MSYSDMGTDRPGAPTESPIHGQLNIQEKRIEELMQKVTTLEQRLSPICISVLATAPVSGNAKEVGPAESEYLQRIRSTNHRLENIIENINELLSRLQI